MKRIEAPHLGLDADGNPQCVVVGGRRRASPDHPAHRYALKLGDFLPNSTVSFTVPDSVDYTAKAGDALRQMYLNSRFACCTIAGFWHLRGIFSANADAPVVIATDAQIIADYQANCPGFDPNTGANDDGCNEVEVLDYYVKQGEAVCFCRVDATNEALVKASSYLFENGYLGIVLRPSYLDPMPMPGSVWDLDAKAADPNDGHCVVAAGFGPIPNDPQGRSGLRISTWGMVIWMTLPAVAAYCTAAQDGEYYVVLSEEILARAQAKAPNALDWPSLVSAFRAVYAQQSQDAGMPAAPSELPASGADGLASAPADEPHS